ncbi:glycosyltransferase family 39 protein [Clostridium sp. WILCCON 0269]|uniref:Glycosyltransferase family 39 protein n=1 Tax=Candidatus Clostridium eludens TaxID=3381663 RepID=A0ABW8SRP1_9CLOT
MKKEKFTKQYIPLMLIILLSAVLNFVNLGIEGTANAYYAAAAKSMTMSLKNFFFVSFDPAGFVTIDKPPVGFWLQAISAKILGFSGWSIILPQALAGIVSVILIYHLVKRSFGNTSGLLAALFLAVTPVFVAASRNNTIDNVLVMILLFACWSLFIAAEKGQFKYLILSIVLVGIGFNVKMAEAYMIVPALYITYLLATSVSLKKRIIHLAVSTVVLAAVSLSWALAVDLTPASSRPYVDSSTNNTEMELIVGHNGLERIGLGSNSNPGISQKQSSNNKTSDNSSSKENQGLTGSNEQMGQFHGHTGSNSGLSGNFGSQVPAGLTRLFTKSMLSDQIVWFMPLALFGFAAAAIGEKLKFRLDNMRKSSLLLWFMCFLPEFIYFSFTTGTYHPYYLTMLAPPIAALAAIGITSMWEFYKGDGWKTWLLPSAFLVTGAVHLLMLSYFISYSSSIKVLIVVVAVSTIIASIILSLLNLKRNNSESGTMNKLRYSLVSLALIGLSITPLVGSSAAMFVKLDNSVPTAGLELLSNKGSQMSGSFSGGSSESSSSSLIQFLEKNRTAEQKYLLVVPSSNTNSASDIIIQTGETVMSLGGFAGSDQILTLAQFKQLVKNGEIRYVMAGGRSDKSTTIQIMNWVKQNGKLVSSNEYSSTDSSTTNLDRQNMEGFGGDNSGQLYDLKAYTDSSTTN